MPRLRSAAPSLFSKEAPSLRPSHHIGKIALVTGASRGIGRAIAERLGRAGAVVAVHYGHDEAAAARTRTAIEAAGGDAFLVRSEFGVDGDVDLLFAELERGLGGRCRPASWTPT